MLGVLLLTGAAMQSAPWPYRLEWEHDGAQLTHFELCVDNECNRIDAARTQGASTWTAAVPVLSQGLHTLVVYACFNGACTAGTPPISINVTPGPSINQPNQPGPANPPSPPVTPPPGRKAPPRRPPKV